jgi:hypothetical protein
MNPAMGGAAATADKACDVGVTALAGNTAPIDALKSAPTW